MISEPTKKYYVNDGCPLCKGELVWDDEKLGKLFCNRIKLVVNPLNYPLLFYKFGRSLYYQHSSKYKVIKEYLYCKRCGNYFFVCPNCGEFDRNGITAPEKEMLIKKVCKTCHKLYIYSSFTGDEIPEDKMTCPLT